MTAECPGDGSNMDSAANAVVEAAVAGVAAVDVRAAAAVVVVAAAAAAPGAAAGDAAAAADVRGLLFFAAFPMSPLLRWGAPISGGPQHSGNKKTLDPGAPWGSLYDTPFETGGTSGGSSLSAATAEGVQLIRRQTISI